MASKVIRAEIMQLFKLTCARCGGPATAYPYPLPEGSVFCPVCSPAWLESFLKFAVAHA